MAQATDFILVALLIAMFDPISAHPPLTELVRWNLPTDYGPITKFDHLVLSEDNILFVACKAVSRVLALNHRGELVGAINVTQPQGVEIVRDLLWVASDGDAPEGGSVSAFDITSKGYPRVHFLQFDTDADDVHYDDDTDKLLVAVGDAPTSRIVEIDVKSGAVTGSYPMPAHVEGFAVVTGTEMVIAATPNANSTIHFVNRTSSKITETWKMPSGYILPFPIVYDAENRVLFVGARGTVPQSNAGALLVLDLDNSGSLLYASPVYLDADDLSVDMSKPTARRVFISAGNNTLPPTTGGISCFVQRSRNQYESLGTYDTGVFAKTSLLDAKSQRLFTAVPSTSSSPAYILVLHIQL